MARRKSGGEREKQKRAGVSGGRAGGLKDHIHTHTYTIPNTIYYIYTCIYIYTHTYTFRNVWHAERAGEFKYHIYIYTHIHYVKDYIHIYTYIYTHNSKTRAIARQTSCSTGTYVLTS